MTDAHDATRRKLVIAASAAGAGLLLTAGNAGLVLAAQKGHGKGHEKEVGAVEDLMREHGVLRRALPAPANTSRGGESGRPGGHRQSGARKVKFARASPLEGDGFESSSPVSGQRVEIATFERFITFCAVAKRSEIRTCNTVRGPFVRLAGRSFGDFKPAQPSPNIPSLSP